MIKSLRYGALAAITLALAALFGASLIRADYNSERRIDMYNIHNGETISIVYKKDGKYVQDALDKLNWFMRDWRANKSTTMDPHTIDLVWEIHEELGSKQPIHFVSGYRSPGTNEALRKAGGGQAKHSQHILGKAMDVAFPDVSVQKLRYAGLVREAGGVGYYPTSGVPFVHIDTGNVRMWPRMPRYELALLFPKGHSKYVPQDGRPISGSDVSYARGHYTQMAEAIAAFHQFRAEPKDHTMVASLDAAPQAVAAVDESADEAAPVPEPAARTAALVTAKPMQAASLQPVALAASGDDGAPVLDGPALTAARRPKLVVKIPKPVVASLELASLITADIVPPNPSPATRPAVASESSGILSIAATVSATAQAPGSGEPELFAPPKPIEISSSQAFMNQSGWVSAPGYDDDHDSELSYRPFPLAGLIDAVPSMDNPILSKLSRPNIAAAHDSIGRDDGMGMQFRPSLQVAELIWSDAFAGDDTAKGLYADAAAINAKPGRMVRTASTN